jgi:methionyl-tRNA synthetase
MSRPGFYVTTPIYYVTDSPHIGNSYTTIAADALARYKRQCGYDVHFLTGTDEHGLKVQRAAQAEGLSPRELADRVVAAYHNAWKRLEISHDDFIRTTEERHERVVQLIFQRWRDSGDLYPGEYKGWYCVSCESFLKESDEPNPKCPDCGRPTEWNAEASYFFRLSRYQERLLKLYDERPDFVRPSGRMNELRTRVAAGLRDLSATRTTLEWAVPLTFDPAHRAYVWIDALINYVSAVGYATDEETFRRRWPADVQLIGKDILWFHAAIWPAMLMALGLEPPKGVFAHGWWTHNGEKMSKSRNNFVTPGEVADAYGADALRYFLLRELPFGLDGDFRDSAMLQRYNSELAGDLGNFVFRTLSMMDRYFEGVVPDPGAEPRGPLAEASASIYADVDACMAELQFSRALERIWEFVRRANQYVEERKPWSQAKDPAQRPALAATLYHLAEASRILSLLIEPTMPASAQAIREQLGVAEEKRPLAEALAWGGLKPGTKIRRGQPLFPKKEADG